MVSREITYRTSINVEADIHNGGSFFVKYFFFEAVLNVGKIEIYQCYISSRDDAAVNKKVKESFGFFVETNISDVYRLDLVSAYNSKYIISSSVMLAGDELIILNHKNNSARMFLKT